MPSLISACAAAKMLERGIFAHYPRGVRARSEHTPRFRRAFAARSLLCAPNTWKEQAARPGPPPHRHSNDGMGPKLGGGGEFSCMLVCLLCVRRVGELDAASRPSRRSRRRFHCVGHAVGWNCSAKRRIGTAVAMMREAVDQYSGGSSRQKSMLNLMLVCHLGFLPLQRLSRSPNARIRDPLGSCWLAMPIYLNCKGGRSRGAAAPPSMKGRSP